MKPRTNRRFSRTAYTGSGYKLWSNACQRSYRLELRHELKELQGRQPSMTPRRIEEWEQFFDYCFLSREKIELTVAGRRQEEAVYVLERLEDWAQDFIKNALAILDEGLSPKETEAAMPKGKA